MSDSVILRRNGPVLEVTLNRPDKLNAFNADLVEGLHGAVAQATVDQCRALLFRGGGKGFSGGFDLTGLKQASDGDLLLRFVRVEQLLQAVTHAPFATIALVHGPCYGAAADLVAACQKRIASPDARFRMPGALFGLVLGMGRLTALVGADNARKLVQRKQAFNVHQALETGFVSEIAKTENWDKRVQDRLSDVSLFDFDTYSGLSSRQRPDTRAADLEALVTSVTSSSIKARLENYLISLR